MFDDPEFVREQKQLDFGFDQLLKEQHKVEAIEELGLGVLLIYIGLSLLLMAGIISTFICLIIVMSQRKRSRELVFIQQVEQEANDANPKMRA